MSCQSGRAWSSSSLKPMANAVLNTVNVGVEYTPPEQVLDIGSPDQDGASAGATASHALPG